MPLRNGRCYAGEAKAAKHLAPFNFIPIFFMRNSLHVTSSDFLLPVANARPDASDMLRKASKLARLAIELLEASAAALEQVMSLARQGIEDSSRATASLTMLLQRLDLSFPHLGGKPVSAEELSAATATARRLMLRSGETVVQMRMTIDGETISERYCWSERRVGATMLQLHAGLDELAQGATDTAAGWPVVYAEISTIERGIHSMRNVARQHRSVADKALRTATKLQTQAIHFVRVLEQTALK